MHPESKSPLESALSPISLAAHLRVAVGELVRATRAVDRLAPIPAAVLDQLDVHGPLTTAELAAGRGVRHQTMAASVKELVDVGYVVPERDPHDARKKALRLTDAGKHAIDEDRVRRVGLLAEALETALNAEERHALAHALTLIDRISASVAALRDGGDSGEGGATGDSEGTGDTGDRDGEGSGVGYGRGPGNSAESTPASVRGPITGAW